MVIGDRLLSATDPLPAFSHANVAARGPASQRVHNSMVNLHHWAIAITLCCLAGCDASYNAGPLLYQAQTPGCLGWDDGSNFGLPDSVSVFASAPERAPNGGVILGLAYLVPRGRSIAFSSQEFDIRDPKSLAQVRGVVTRVDRSVVGIHPSEQPENLASLPKTITAIDRGDETMVRVDLRFATAPSRFDLLHPRMLIDGTSYPVRTFTYRWFPERSRFGLCS